MINVVLCNVLGVPQTCLSYEQIAVLFADAIADGRLRSIYMTTRPLAQALLLQKIGVINLCHGYPI